MWLLFMCSGKQCAVCTTPEPHKILRNTTKHTELRLFVIKSGAQHARNICAPDKHASPHASLHAQPSKEKLTHVHSLWNVKSRWMSRQAVEGMGGAGQKKSRSDCLATLRWHKLQPLQQLLLGCYEGQNDIAERQRQWAAWKKCFSYFLICVYWLLFCLCVCECRAAAAHMCS